VGFAGVHDPHPSLQDAETKRTHGYSPSAWDTFESVPSGM
jgi:hypothetical protein